MDTTRGVPLATGRYTSLSSKWTNTAPARPIVRRDISVFRQLGQARYLQLSSARYYGFQIEYHAADCFLVTAYITPDIATLLVEHISGMVDYRGDDCGNEITSAHLRAVGTSPPKRFTHTAA